MFKNLVLCLALISVVACGSKPRVTIQDDGIQLKPNIQHEVIAKEVVNLLENHSYKKVAASDSLSNIVFDNLLKAVDRGKTYLLKSDVESFEPYRNTVSQDMRKGDLSVPFHIFNVYSERYLEAIEYALSQVDAEHDFTLDENFTNFREKLDWFHTEEEMKDHWRKRVKFDRVLAKQHWPKLSRD